MPYAIEPNFDGCAFAVVKIADDGTKVVVPGGCHTSGEQSLAEDHLAALNIALQSERADPPAPPKDQITGSDKNEPGSAGDKTGKIELTEANEIALQNKADEHNESMNKSNRPAWTKVRVGSLRSVYRRGLGAFSGSHRPGIGRNQWAMARVNAFLFLARTGKPNNSKYVGDNDLLHSDHPRYSQDQKRATDPNGYMTTDGMRAEAERGLAWRREFGRGGTEVGIARARDISNGKRLPYETVVRMNSFFARHTVDKQAQGFRPGEDGFPSNGRIAWALWGGDAGERWAGAIIDAADKNGDRMTSKGDDMSIEFRTAAVELRAVDETGMTFEGYAALYDSPSDTGVAPEIIKPGAFRRSLAATERGEWDVKAYQDHNPELLLGTTKSGTLTLDDDGKGLRARISLNPNISFHRDLAEIVKTMGKSLGMSFGFFSTNANKVNDEGVRELRDVKLVEVSALTGLAPYYPGTISTVAVRSLASDSGIDVAALREAVVALLAGNMNPDQAKVIAQAVRAVIEDDEPDAVESVDPDQETTSEKPNPDEYDETMADDDDEGKELQDHQPSVTVHIDVVIPSGVPRSIRERQIELARRALD